MDMSRPTTMRAIAIDRFGGVDELHPAELPIPDVAAHQVLIRLTTAGVGEWDPFEREGGYAEMMGLQPVFPYVLGSEGSGEVVVAGDAVDRIACSTSKAAEGHLRRVTAMSPSRTARLALVAAATAVLAVGCSGTSTIAQSELEKQAANQLAEEVDNGTVPDIACPGDLESEVGATTECELTVEGDDAVYPVSIEVTEVDDGVASFSIQVAEAPAE